MKTKQDDNLYSHKIENLEKEVQLFITKPPDAKMTVRDYSILIELWQVYDDMLGEMENMELDFHPQVIVTTDGEKIRFGNIDEVAEWLSPFMTG